MKPIDARRNRGFLTDRSGATAVEWTLLASLLAVALLAGVEPIADALIPLLEGAEDGVETIRSP